MKIEFTVYGEPVSKKRHRHTKFNMVYSPKENVCAERDIKTQSLATKPQKPIDNVPITLVCKFYRSIPKNFSAKKRALAELGVIRPITKPDADNLIKLVKDALNSIYWRDDSLVVDERSIKYYSISPRTEIEINY